MAYKVWRGGKYVEENQGLAGKAIWGKVAVFRNGQSKKVWQKGMVLKTDVENDGVESYVVQMKTVQRRYRADSGGIVFLIEQNLKPWGNYGDVIFG